jgi:hypothetical protein
MCFEAFPADFWRCRKGLEVVQAYDAVIDGLRCRC